MLGELLFGKLFQNSIINGLFDEFSWVPTISPISLTRQLSPHQWNSVLCSFLKYALLWKSSRSYSSSDSTRTNETTNIDRYAKLIICLVTVCCTKRQWVAGSQISRYRSWVENCWRGLASSTQSREATVQWESRPFWKDSSRVLNIAKPQDYSLPTICSRLKIVQSELP